MSTKPEELHKCSEAILQFSESARPLCHSCTILSRNTIVGSLQRKVPKHRDALLEAQEVLAEYLKGPSFSSKHNHMEEDWADRSQTCKEANSDDMSMR